MSTTDLPASLKERHNYILQTYILNRKSKHKHDINVIRENHRFLWNDEKVESWEEELARRYYDKLFKEYCIADLTRYKENKIALRWRCESEVVSGKGQFICGSRKCNEGEGLRSWEVNFGYMEHGEKKNALVKVRLCPEHSDQLNYTSKKREVKRLKRSQKEKRKGKKRRSSDDKDKRQSNVKEETGTTSQEEEEEEAADVEEKARGKESDEEYRTEEDENIWSKKPEMEVETTVRETDFERYLEDMLL